MATNKLEGIRGKLTLRARQKPAPMESHPWGIATNQLTIPITLSTGKAWVKPKSQLFAIMDSLQKHIGRTLVFWPHDRDLCITGLRAGLYTPAIASRSLRFRSKTRSRSTTVELRVDRRKGGNLRKFANGIPKGIPIKKTIHKNHKVMQSIQITPAPKYEAPPKPALCGFCCFWASEKTPPNRVPDISFKTSRH